MTLPNNTRSGSILLRRDINSNIQFSNSFSGKLELESDPRVSKFLFGADTFILRELFFRFQPVNSSKAPHHGYGRLDIDFDASYVLADATSDQSSSTVSRRFHQTFSFHLKYSSPSFPVSYSKLLCRQYSTRDSSGTYKLPVINYKLDTSDFQSVNVGYIFVDWVIDRIVDNPPVFDAGDDAVDT